MKINRIHGNTIIKINRENKSITFCKKNPVGLLVKPFNYLEMPFANTIKRSFSSFGILYVKRENEELRINVEKKTRLDDYSDSDDEKTPTQTNYKELAKKEKGKEKLEYEEDELFDDEKYNDTLDLMETHKNIKELLEKNIPEKISKHQLIDPEDLKKYKDLEEEYSSYFEDNSDNISALKDLEEDISNQIGLPSIFESLSLKKDETKKEVEEKYTEKSTESPVDFVIGKLESDMPSYTDPDD